jgi:hypothetical protein
VGNHRSEVRNLRLIPGKTARYYSKRTKAKKKRKKKERSGRASALQTQDPEFKH